MSLGHGAKVVRDGLVFHYDMANTKSWRGRPITNIVSNTNLDTGWSKGYNVNIEWNDYPSPIGINSDVVSFVDADGNGSGYWYSYGNYAPQGDGVTYYVSVWARTVGQDWTIRPYTGDNSEANRIWLDQLTVPGDGKWHRLEFNPITTANPNDSDSLSFSFSYIPPNQKCWLCAPQMTEHGHVPFVDGTRSATESIIDLTGNSTITASSLTYNSDNTFSFGGSDNLTLGNNTLITGAFTIDTWFKSGASQNGAQYATIVGKDDAGSFGNFIMSSDLNSTYIRAGFSGSAGQKETSNSSYNTDFTSQSWVNYICTWDGNSVITLYRNGEQISQNTSATGTLTTNTNDLYIGYRTANNTSYFTGDIGSVKLYNNKALTANEVKQNFNAMRGRYGI